MTDPRDSCRSTVKIENFRILFRLKSARIFLFSSASKPTLGATQIPVRWVRRLFPNIKLMELGEAKIRRLARYYIRMSQVYWYIAE